MSRYDDVQLCAGREWSLTVFPDVGTALRAEEIWNRKVAGEGLTARWSVGQAVVRGRLGEQDLETFFDKWREEAAEQAKEVDNV